MTFHRIKSDKPSKCVPESCRRCGGGGVVPPWGSCFRCGGCGQDPTDRGWGFPVAWTDEQCEAFVLKKDEQAEARRVSAATKRFAKRDAIWAANVEACPVLVEFREKFVLFDADGVPRHELPEVSRLATQWEAEFIRDIEAKAHRFPISEKQAALAVSIRQKIAERAAQKRAEQENAKPVPEGRVEVVGTILSVKTSEVSYGYHQSAIAWKALIRCDGYKLFGTIPASILDGVDDPKTLVGSQVKFTAKVEPKEPGFGFYSRPTSGELVAAS